LIAGPQQILELSAAEDVLNVLRQLGSTGSNHAGASGGGSGTFNPSPECSRSGELQKLVVSYDDRVLFTRTRSRR
jgi:hypothetical protein